MVYHENLVIICCFHTFLMFSQSYIFNFCIYFIYFFFAGFFPFSFVCVFLFVAVVIVVVVAFVAVIIVVVVVVVKFLPTCFFLQVVHRWQGRAMVLSVIPAPICNDLNSCDRNSAENDIGKGVREALYNPDIYA